MENTDPFCEPGNEEPLHDAPGAGPKAVTPPSGETPADKVASALAGKKEGPADASGKDPGKSPKGTGPATTTDPAKGKPQTPQQMLAKYEQLGKDHPTVLELKEALARGQQDVVQTLTQKLDGMLTAKPEVKPEAPKTQPAGGRFIYVVCGTLLISGLLVGLGFIYVNRHAREVIERNPKVIMTARMVTGKRLGGYSADEITQWVIQEIEEIKPDNILFAGNSLYKRELVEYLSAQAAKGTTVALLIGKGSPLLGRDAANLNRYPFTYVMAAAEPLNTQVLAAFNVAEGRAVAFVGTYPFDRTLADSTENTLIEIVDLKQCNKLLDTYQELISKSTMIHRKGK